MGKALLVVSFGTSVPGVAEKTIGAVERALAGAFPDRTLYTAWTSKFICAKVERETGVHHMQLPEVLDAMEADGVDDLLVQPTHMMQGYENNLVLEALRGAEGRFATVRVGNTLLAREEDCAVLAQALCARFSDMAAGDALVLMGHGSETGGNEAYARMQQAFADAGRSDVVVGTVEGEPTFEDVQEALGRLAPERVWLAPFMIVAGDHALNDLAGEEEDSWKSQIEARGMQAVAVLAGMGEYPEVQRIFVEHAQQAAVLA